MNINVVMNKGLQKIYAEIPGTYELINHILTFGVDIISRRRAAKIASAQGGKKWLDVCCGTGEMTSKLNHLKKNGTTVFGADFSYPMLINALKKKNNSRACFTVAEAGSLPFKSDTFDLVTISFATRNLNSSRESLIVRFKDILRILKSGGIFVNLETSQPENRVIRFFMHLYVRLAVRQIGMLISGNKAGYSYLASSIPAFYGRETLKNILLESGFKQVTHMNFFAGIIALHIAEK